MGAPPWAYGVGTPLAGSAEKQKERVQSLIESMPVPFHK
jgi:hypothetical protein